MIPLLIRRFLLGIATIWIISVLVFAGTEILPGDVATAILGQSATPEAVAAIRENLGLDRPAVVRYGIWLAKMLRGDMGTSLATNRPIASIILDRLKNTFFLAAITAIFSVPISVILGIISAGKPDKLLDRSISILSLVAISAPEFFTGSILVIIFAVSLHVLPSISYISETTTPLGVIKAMVLPMLTLTAAMLAHMTRMTRAAILEVLRSPYIEMAILKGVPKKRIIFRHAIPNALGPIINVIALNLGYLVAGVVIVEVIFAFPGLGRLMVDAVTSRDVPMVQSVAMIFCSVYVGVNLMADLLVLATNPRLRQKR